MAVERGETRGGEARGEERAERVLSLALPPAGTSARQGSAGRREGVEGVERDHARPVPAPPRNRACQTLPSLPLGTVVVVGDVADG